MLIQAKAHDKKSAKPDAKGPFQFTRSEKRTKLPAWMAMALAGLFAYFKEVSIGPSAEAALANGHGGHEPADSPREHDLAASEAKLNDHAPAGARPPQSQLGEPQYALSDEPALTAFNSSRQLVTGSSALAPQVRNAYADNDNRLFSWPGSAVPELPDYRRPIAAVLPFAPRSIDANPPDDHGSSAPISTPVTTPAPTQQDPAAPATSPGAAPPPADPGAPKTNRAPVVSGPVRLNNVIVGQTMLLALGDLLLGARDADGDNLLISNITPSNGTLVQIDDGWSYHANAGAETLTTLSYDITDGHEVVHQTADFRVLSAVRTLTPGDDVHVGSANADQIDGLDGDDLIDAGAGNDIVFGGNGADHILGGAGDDILFGGAGDDIIFGGAGNDLISGGDGNDRLFGGDGDDVVSGDAGDDYLLGGNGNDLLQGGAGNDVIDGGAGDDDLDGGDGIDTLDYSASSAAVQVDLVAGTASGDTIGNDVIANFEKIVGSSADDLFRASEDAISIAGGSGNDSYQVNAGGSHLQITDFAVGDRIHVGAYEVMERTVSSVAPDFTDVYSDVPNEGALPIKAHNGVCDGFDVTVLEARSQDDAKGEHEDGHDSYDIYISLSGHHDLVYVLHAIA